MTKPLIDIAANLTHDSFDEDRDAVFQNALDAGVGKFLIVGTDRASSGQALTLCEQRPHDSRATVGLHPHHASDWSDELHDMYQDWLQHPLCSAAGEMGLDYFRNFSSPEDQKKAFSAQLKLAVDSQLPAYLHVREAFDDFYPMLKEVRGDLSQAIVHCFTGSREEMEAYVELDCGIGITGWVCDERRGEELQRIVPWIPDDRLMIETDAPYLLPRTLTPRPKTRRNEPKYLPEVLRVVAQLREVSESELSEQLWNNTHRYFSFDAQSGVI